MTSSKGIFAEEEMVLLFDGKKYKNLSNNGQNTIRTILGHIDVYILPL